MSHSEKRICRSDIAGKGSVDRKDAVADGEFAHALAGEDVDRVGDGGRHWRRCRLAEASESVTFFLSSILISDFMFPFEGMPEIARGIAEVLPETHFNWLIRGIILRGADVSTMMQELAALAMSTAVTLTLAVLRFSKQLD